MYWEWPLRPYGRELMPALEYEKLRILHNELEGLQEIYNKQVKATEIMYAVIDLCHSLIVTHIRQGEQHPFGRAERSKSRTHTR